MRRGRYNDGVHRERPSVKGKPGFQIFGGRGRARPKSGSGNGKRRACPSAAHRCSVLRMATCLLVFTSVACSSVEQSREGDAGNVTNVDSTTTTEGARVLGPAWIDQQRWLNASVDNTATLYSDFVLNNPNNLSTPMGALCWVHHEVERAIARAVTRDAVDNDIVPLIIEALGLTVEQVGSGAQATRVLRELLGDQDSSVSGAVGEIDNNSGNNSDAGTIDISEDDLTITDDLLTYFKLNWKNNTEPFDEIGGDGTEWVDMFKEVVKPDIVAATRAGPGLPISIQSFVDALFTAVAEFLDGTRTDLLDPNGLSYKLPNWDQFVEEAKYSQDCQRAWLFVESNEER